MAGIFHYLDEEYFFLFFSGEDSSHQWLRFSSESEGRLASANAKETLDLVANVAMKRWLVDAIYAGHRVQLNCKLISLSARPICTAYESTWDCVICMGEEEEEGNKSNLLDLRCRKVSSCCIKMNSIEELNWLCSVRVNCQEVWRGHIFIQAVVLLRGLFSLHAPPPAHCLVARWWLAKCKLCLFSSVSVCLCVSSHFHAHLSHFMWWIVVDCFSFFLFSLLRPPSATRGGILVSHEALIRSCRHFSMDVSEHRGWAQTQRTTERDDENMRGKRKWVSEWDMKEKQRRQSERKKRSEKGRRKK